MRENAARLRYSTKSPAPTDRPTKKLVLVNELLREAVSRAAKGCRADADTLLTAIRVLEADRLSEVTAPSSGRVSALFECAVRAHRAQALDKAEPLYRAVILFAPSHAMVWSNLAAVLTQMDDVDEAVAACHKALDISPTHLNAHINLAGALQKKGAFDEAAEILRRGLTYHPNRVDLRRALGVVLELAGCLEDALAVYDEWIEIAPDSTDAYKAKAEALRKLERIEEAIGCYANVASIDPDNAAAYSAMGTLMALDSPAYDLNEAASLCLRAATLKPGSPIILNNLGVVLRLRGDVDQALLVFQGLTRIDPDFAPAHSAIDEILRDQGHHDEADKSDQPSPSHRNASAEIQADVTKVRCDIQLRSTHFELRSPAI